MQSKILITGGDGYNVLPDNTLSGEYLKNSISYTTCVNSDQDYTIGNTASTQVTFDTTFSQLGTNTTFELYTQQMYETSFRKVGEFKIYSIEKGSGIVNPSYAVTAYDAVCDLDVDCSAWLSGRGSETLYSLFRAISIQYTGKYPSTAQENFLNATLTVKPSDLITAGVTARTIVQYIAELAGGFVVADSNGQLSMRKFSDKGVSIDGSYYSSITIADRPAPQIRKLTAQLSSGICTVTTSTGTADMQILFNPIIYNQASSSVQGWLSRLLSSVNSVGEYYAFKCHLIGDAVDTSPLKYIEAGDIITIEGKKALVFTKQVSSGGVDIYGTGGPTRQSQVTNNDDRITNLEANKNSSDYLTTNWMNDSSTKIFNSQIYCNDIIIPSGLGYQGNLNNTSLISVIQAILRTIPSLSPAVIDQNLVLRMRPVDYGYGNQTFTTPFTSADVDSITKNPAGSDITYTTNSAGYYVISCPGPTDGDIEFRKGGVLRATYHITSVDTIFRATQTYTIPFPPYTDYGDEWFCYVYIYDYLTQSTIVRGVDRDFETTSTGVPGNPNSITPNHLSMEWSEQDSGLNTVFTRSSTMPKPRLYRIRYSNREHPDEQDAVYTGYYYVEE